MHIMVKINNACGEGYKMLYYSSVGNTFIKFVNDEHRKCTYMHVVLRTIWKSNHRPHRDCIVLDCTYIVNLQMKNKKGKR